MVSKAISQIGISNTSQGKHVKLCTCLTYQSSLLKKRTCQCTYRGCNIKFYQGQKKNMELFCGFFIFKPLPKTICLRPLPHPARHRPWQKLKWIKSSLNMHLIVNHMQVKRIRVQFVKWQNLTPLKNSPFGSLQTQKREAPNDLLTCQRLFRQNKDLMITPSVGFFKKINTKYN